jgi:hypothetical protein
VAAVTNDFLKSRHDLGGRAMTLYGPRDENLCNEREQGKYCGASAGIRKRGNGVYG